MNIILKSVLVTKSAVFLTSQDIIFRYTSVYHGEAFQTRIFPKLASELMFAQCLEKQKTVRLSSLRNNNS